MTAWTPELAERLRTALAAGKSVAIAAEELGVTRNAAMGIAKRRGMDMGAPTITRPPGGGRPPKPPKRRDYVYLAPARVRPRPSVLRAALTPPPSLGLRLMDLHNNDCHWPYGGGPFLYCGHPAVELRSYCPAHMALAYQPVRR